MTVWLAAVTGTKPAFLLLEGRGPCAWRFVVGIFPMAPDWPQLWVFQYLYLSSCSEGSQLDFSFLSSAIEPRTLHIPFKHTTIELHPSEVERVGYLRI